MSRPVIVSSLSLFFGLWDTLRWVLTHWCGDGHRRHQLVGSGTHQDVVKVVEVVVDTCWCVHVVVVVVVVVVILSIIKISSWKKDKKCTWGLRHVHVLSPFCSAPHSHLKKIEPSKSLVSIQKTQKKRRKKAYQHISCIVWAHFHHCLSMSSPDAAAAISVVVRCVMVMVVVGTVVEAMVDVFWHFHMSHSSSKGLKTRVVVIRCCGGHGGYGCGGWGGDVMWWCIKVVLLVLVVT